MSGRWFSLQGTQQRWAWWGIAWVAVGGLGGNVASGHEPSRPAPVQPSRVARQAPPKTVPVASRASSVGFPTRAANVAATGQSQLPHPSQNALPGGQSTEPPDQTGAADGDELFGDRAIKTIQQIVEQEMGKGVLVGQWNYVDRRSALVWPWQEPAACHDLSAYQPVDCGPIDWRRSTPSEVDSRSDAVVGTAPRRVKSWPR